ncbi:MAG: HD domain-containing protein [Planctomycetota bacterium]
MTSRRYSVFRDTVHGDLYLTADEVRLLDTPQMQRLRGVRQLGTTYLVYPGAHHTRFEHSLGTLHIAQRMMDAINLNRSLDPAACLGVSKEEARIVRIAALVHDITHIPFGHNIEDQTGLFRRHDTRERFLERFDNTEVGDVLRRLRLLDDVLAVVAPDPSAASRVPRYWSQIVAGTIGADILDYLKRDAYYTGLNLYYDERIVNYFKVDRGRGGLYIDCAKRQLLREDIVSEIVRVLEARYYFSERVYYHHAKIAAGALVAKSVEEAIVSGAARESDFYDQTDETLLDFLGRLIYPSAEVRDRVRGSLRQFRARQLPKRCCVYPAYANRELQDELVHLYCAPESYRARRAKEEAIAARATQQAGRSDIIVLIYCPARRMQLKEAEIDVLVPGHPEPRPMKDLAGTLWRAGDLAQAYRDLWKLYVLAWPPEPGVLRAVADACRMEIPEARNSYEPPG